MVDTQVCNANCSFAEVLDAVQPRRELTVCVTSIRKPWALPGKLRLELPRLLVAR
jgi:hypothetical protein